MIDAPPHRNGHHPELISGQLSDMRGEAILTAIFDDPSLINRMPVGLATAMPGDKSAATYSAMLALHHEGTAIELVRVAERLASSTATSSRMNDWLPWLMDIHRGPCSTAMPIQLAQELIAEKRLLSRRMAIEDLIREAAVPGFTNGDLTQRLRALTEEPASSAAVVNVGTLIDDHPALREYVIEGLCRVGEVVNFVSKSKVGKSWSVYAMLLSVVMGWLWLGKFHCRAGKVLLIDNELHPSDLAHRIATVADALGIVPDHYRDSFHVLPLRGRLTDIYQLGGLLRDMRGAGYSVVVIDALYRMFPEGMSENDNAAVAQLYNAVDRYAEMMNAAFVLVHHATKGGQSEKDVTDVGSGAGSQSRAADTHIVLRPHEQENCVVFDAAIRSSAPIDPFVLEWGFPLWQPADDLDPNQLKTAKGKAASDAAEQRFNEKRQRVFDYLLSIRPQAATKSAIKDHSGVNAGIAQILDSLVADGNILPAEVTIESNGKTYPGWQAAEFGESQC